ncbi:AAA family ATPase [Stenotrophomonas muris]|uniref:AAA family ATPase n=1 Tax=Stenotrophomonas muris TaxID=2963283 RepID=UPI0040556685
MPGIRISLPRLAPQQRPPSFATLLAGEKYYRALKDWCGSDAEYHSILRQLHDITLELAETPGPRVERIRASNEFRLGVLRNAGAYRAFRTGYLCRTGNASADARIDFQYDVTLASTGDVCIPFIHRDNDYVADRIHCIVGKNGVGKSRILASLVRTLAGDQRSLLEYDWNGPREHGAVTLGYFDGVAQPSYANHFSRVIAYSTEFEHQYPTHTHPSSSFDYLHFSLTSGLTGNPRSDSNTRCARAMVDLLRDHDPVGEVGPDRYSWLKKYCQDHIPWSDLCLPVEEGIDDRAIFSDQEGYWIKLEHLRHAGEQRTLELTGALAEDRDIAFFNDEGIRVRISSGQRTYLRFAIHIISFISKGSLIILDEPETHLHPNLISQLMLLLNQVASTFESLALIATHSVHVVREVPTHCTHVLTRTEEGTSTKHVYLPTLGASPTLLSLAIFGDDSVPRHSNEIVKKIINSNLSMKEVIKDLSGLISTEMLTEIRRGIEEQSS